MFMFFLTHTTSLNRHSTCRARGLHSSVFSSRANYETGSLGYHTTQHAVVQTRPEERENTSWEGGGPQTTRVTSPSLYLLKLSWFGSGPTGPSFTPCFPRLHTQKQHAAKKISCCSCPTRMHILNMLTYTHTHTLCRSDLRIRPSKCECSPLRGLHKGGKSTRGLPVTGFFVLSLYCINITCAGHSSES